MKKVLLGLVIALITTGYGFSYENENWKKAECGSMMKLLNKNCGSQSKEYYCKSIHKQAVKSLKEAQQLFENRKYFSKKDYSNEPNKDILNNTRKETIESLTDGHMARIKLASELTLIWSEICD
mgnify:CR=1 FL=1